MRFFRVNKISGFEHIVKQKLSFFICVMWELKNTFDHFRLYAQVIIIQTYFSRFQTENSVCQ